MTEALVDLKDVTKTFGARPRGLFGRAAKAGVRAVKGVNLTLEKGETLGLVGESGSGKSTLARMIVGLETADEGEVRVLGQSLVTMPTSARRALCAHVQMVFQDPYSSLDPTKTVSHLIEEPLRLHTSLTREERRSRVHELLADVSLPKEVAGRRPASMSGGQRQRVAIARAIALAPQVVVADEAVSALDVSTQAQVISLLARLKREHGLSYLFVSHDLRLVRHVSDRIAVMYQGEVVELGAAAQVYDHPTHPYTKKLLASVPSPIPRKHRPATQELAPRHREESTGGRQPKDDAAPATDAARA